MHGHLRIALRITFNGDRIAAIEATADAERIATLDVEVLER
jgi:RNA polymerase sigma-70 factor (ECF subfamily)